MQKFPILPDAYKQMEQELKQLKNADRPTVIQAIAEARAHGDLSENAEYHAAREKQSFIEGRIMELEDKIARAEVIDVTGVTSTRVMFGAGVHLVDEETEEEIYYQIVGEYEANLEQNRISIVSPLARALIGKQQGDSVEVTTPKGIKYFEVVKVLYG